VIHFNFSRLFTLHFLCGFSFFRSDLYLSFLLTIFSEYLCFCISYSWNHAGTFHQVLFFFPFESPSPFLKLLEFANVTFIFFFFPFLHLVCFFPSIFQNIRSYQQHACYFFSQFHHTILREVYIFFSFLSFFTAQYMSRGSFGLGIVRDMVVNKLRWFAVTVGKF